jgi:hypothetical protein
MRLHDTQEGRRRERGSYSVLTALALVGLIGFVALVVDTGRIMVTKAELQNTADAAAAAATSELAKIYADLPGSVNPSEYELTALDKARIANAANRISKRNSAAGKNIEVLPADLFYGKWNGQARELESGSEGVQAVRVTARRDEHANGRVKTLLAGIIGHEDFGASAESGARISPARYIPKGVAEFPVGISQHWFEVKGSPCGTDHFLTFYPTGSIDGCAGWHTFESWPANASKLRALLGDIEDGTFEAPAIDVGNSEFVFIGGTVTSALQAVEDVYKARRNLLGQYFVHLPVYEADDCSNPNGRIRIVGIASAVITGVDPKGGDKRVDAHVSCDVVGMGKGDGPDFGTWVGRPQMFD